MEKIKFVPLDCTYKIIEGKAVIELFGKSGREQVCVRVSDFEPYFWTLDSEEVSDDAIVRYEEHKKKYLGLEVAAKKVFVKTPPDVPKLREKFKKALEADIPFAKRFLIDKQITPLLTYEADGGFVNSGYKTAVFEAKNILPLTDDVPGLRVLALDIETHTKIEEGISESGPIIMCALYGEGLKKVITWKSFKNGLDFIEVVENEAALIERVKELIAQHKPDILTGYFSDGFDLPYLKTRAERYKVKFDIGLDNTGISMRKGQVPVAEITGIAHIDIMKFVKRIFRTTMTSFKLDDVAKEILGEGKHAVSIARLYNAWNDNNGELEGFAKYNLQDAKITHDLCIQLLPNIIEFTKLVGLTPAEVSRMSFSQIVEWHLIREAQSFNELAPNKPGFNEEKERRSVSYEGGFVFEPIPGLYKDILVFDFRSLYPTVISAHNISPDTLVKGEDSADGVLKGYSFSEKKGFISTVIENVIERRLRVKELSKKSNDKLLEARQLALKTIANSIYGYYGFFGARWYNLDCAKAITAYGRHHIREVIEKAQKEGLKVLYSDTDSVFIALNGKSIDEVLEFAGRINQDLPGIMGLYY